MTRKNKYIQPSAQDHTSHENEKLRVSFDYVDLDTKEFFFHGMEKGYYAKVFECLTKIQKRTRKEIAQLLSNHNNSLGIKSIFNTTSSSKNSFPKTIIPKLKDKLVGQNLDEQSLDSQATEIISNAFEVKVTAMSRIHGFLYDSTFYIVWFDTAHNLYPGKYGIQKNKDVATVRCVSLEDVQECKQKIQEVESEKQKLQLEIDELYQELGKI